MPAAFRKGTFRWQLVANREVTGSQNVTLLARPRKRLEDFLDIAIHNLIMRA